MDLIPGDRIIHSRDREREERGGSVISVAESMSKKSRRNSIRNHSLQTHRKFYSGGRDLREHLERRAQQAIPGENSVKKNNVRLSTTWRSKMWNEESPNTH